MQDPEHSARHQPLRGDVVHPPGPPLAAPAPDPVSEPVAWAPFETMILNTGCERGNGLFRTVVGTVSETTGCATTGLRNSDADGLWAGQALAERWLDIRARGAT